MLKIEFSRFCFAAPRLWLWVWHLVSSRLVIGRSFKFTMVLPASLSECATHTHTHTHESRMARRDCKYNICYEYIAHFSSNWTEHDRCARKSSRDSTHREHDLLAGIFPSDCAHTTCAVLAILLFSTGSFRPHYQASLIMYYCSVGRTARQARQRRSEFGSVRQSMYNRTWVHVALCSASEP